MITQLTSSLNAFSYIFDCSLYIGITGVVGFFVTNFKDLNPILKVIFLPPLTILDLVWLKFFQWLSEINNLNRLQTGDGGATAHLNLQIRWVYKKWITNNVTNNEVLIVLFTLKIERCEKE